MLSEINIKIQKLVYQQYQKIPPDIKMKIKCKLNVKCTNSEITRNKRTTCKTQKNKFAKKCFCK